MILLNDFKRQWTDTAQDVLRAVEAVGSSGWYILGDRVRSFESHLAAFWRLPHAVGVASGLDAIELSLRALNCGPGDFVLTSPISAFATPLAIVKTGASPVFADCDEFGLVDLDACRRTLEERADIRFFVPVHLYGHALDRWRLLDIRDRFGVAIVEDCAQSVGACSNGEPAGATGQFAATSFYPTKNLGALGDGGAVLTGDVELANAVRCLRDYGQSSKYRHDVLGYNSRLDELHAAILDQAFLPRLQQWTDRRRQIAVRYVREIANPSVTVPGAPPGSESSWHLFPVLVPAGRKSEALSYFKQKGVAVGEHYPLALAEQNALAHVRHQVGECPKAIEFCRREISLPIHPYLRDDEVSLVIQVCNEWR